MLIEHKLVIKALKTSLSEKDRAVMKLERKARTIEYELERMGRVELVGDKWKLNHRLMEEKLKGAKKDLKVADQTLKESFEKQKTGHLLDVATLKLHHETDMSKLKIELATNVLQLKANAGHIKRLDDEVTHLGMRDMRDDNGAEI